MKSKATLYRTDEELVHLAQGGDVGSLTDLVTRYQDRIYNMTLRMAGNPEDAEDRTQEIIIKFITHLSSFKGKSKFSTWLYRITVNHNLNAKRNSWERYFRSFEDHERLRQRFSNIDVGLDDLSGIDSKLLLEETKSMCLSGMLLCLGRKQRIALILGAIFNLDSTTAASIMDTTPANFRQHLSRSKKRMNAYAVNACGLFNPENTCNCIQRMPGVLHMGLIVRGGKPRYPVHLGKIKLFMSRNKYLIDNAVEMKLRNSMRDLPYYRSPNYLRLLKRILDTPELKRIINYKVGDSNE